MFFLQFDEFSYIQTPELIKDHIPQVPKEVRETHSENILTGLTPYLL